MEWGGVWCGVGWGGVGVVGWVGLGWGRHELGWVGAGGVEKCRKDRVECGVDCVGCGVVWCAVGVLGWGRAVQAG